MEILRHAAMTRLLLIVFLVCIPVLLTDWLLGKKPLQTKTVEILTEHLTPKPELPLETVPGLDREAFLSSFSRQASEALSPCLRENLGVAGHITFLARLNKRGNLTGIRIMEPRTLDCAVAAVRGMNFAHLSAPLKIESVEVAWRYDW